MAKSKVTSVLLKILGFLGLIALFIAFLVFIYGLFLYMFEGEELSFKGFSITDVFKKEEKDKKENTEKDKNPENNKKTEDKNNSKEGNLKNQLTICLEENLVIINNI